MKILAITSSPRRNGNSETLLDRALASMKGRNIVVKKVILANLHISPCNGCLACMKTGECIIKDDMQAVYEDLVAADTLLVACPIYFMGLPCQLKCVIDRCQAIWARKYVLKKIQTPSPRRGEGRGEGGKDRRGAAILVCASSSVKDMFTGAIKTLKAWFNTLDFSYKKEFLAEGLEQESAALKDKKLLRQAYKFGEKFTG